MIDAGQADECGSAPRQWRWFGIVAELSKLPVGLSYGLMVLADTLHSACSGLHGDIVSHYNWRLSQDAFRDDVVRDLEMITES